MSPSAKRSALVPAAGSGERLGLGPKAFLKIDGRPLISWVADKMKRVADEVILAVPKERLADTRTLCRDCSCISGASTRQDTVEALAKAATGDILLLHEVARPLCSTDLLNQVCDGALSHGAAGAFFCPQVPIARLSDNGWLEPCLPSSGLAMCQTPQAYKREILQNILKQATLGAWKCQSTIELAVKAGVPIRAIPGELQNFKITTPEDWAVAQSLKEFLK